jgi:uncharacterized protein (UPF0332 family)
VLEPGLYMDRAHDDLQASRAILGQGFYGVAVTRAYYAMFYAASALLSSKGIARSKHSGVHSAFGEHFVKTSLIEVEYAKMLANAFDSRLDSDYDVLFTALLLAGLTWGTFQQRVWAWWGSLFYWGAMAVSVMLTFARTPYLELLAIAGFPPQEITFLDGIPLQGVHLALFFGLPLLLTVGTIIAAKRHFGARNVSD